MSTLPDDLRLLLVHKQKTSARLRFLQFAHGVTAFDPLPALSDINDDEAPQVVHHPNVYLRAAEQRLGLQAGSLENEPEFEALVHTPSGPVAVYLTHINTIDPPFAEAEALGGRFIAITEAIGGMPVDMELLRRAYTVLLG